MLAISESIKQRKQRNQWSVIRWDQIPFDELSRCKKRERLFREADYRCPECGFDKLRSDGKHVLEIDHIDGNHLNETRENLRVLCPNCHALTPNFRNHGRTKFKTSTRFRKENRGYDIARTLIKNQNALYAENFKRIVMSLHESGEIEFGKYGWVNELAFKLNDEVPQSVGKRVRRLMPEFYAEHCFVRGVKRLKTCSGGGMADTNGLGPLS